MPYDKLSLHPDSVARRQMWSQAGRRRESAAQNGETAARDVSNDTNGNQLHSSRRPTSSTTATSAETP